MTSFVSYDVLVFLTQGLGPQLLTHVPPEGASLLWYDFGLSTLHRGGPAPLKPSSQDPLPYLSLPRLPFSLVSTKVLDTPWVQPTFPTHRQVSPPPLSVHSTKPSTVGDRWDTSMSDHYGVQGFLRSRTFVRSVCTRTNLPATGNSFICCGTYLETWNSPFLR